MSNKMSKAQEKNNKASEQEKEGKKRVNLTLTPTATACLDKQANKLHLSRSELVEQIARGLISMTNEDEKYKGFTFYKPQSILLEEKSKLPQAIGSFILTDLENFVHVGSTANLNSQFKDKKFIKQFETFIESKESNIRLIYLRCNSYNSTKKVEQELLSMFRSSDAFRSSSFYKIQLSQKTQELLKEAAIAEAPALRVRKLSLD